MSRPQPPGAACHSGRADVRTAAPAPPPLPGSRREALPCPFLLAPPAPPAPPALPVQSGAPRFPDGLTVQDGRGQWRDSHGVIERERSYELTLLYPASEARVRDARIERIRDAYERTYAQDSVARVDERTTADF